MNGIMIGFDESRTEYLVFDGLRAKPGVGWLKPDLREKVK